MFATVSCKSLLNSFLRTNYKVEATHLAYDEVLLVEMTAEHFRRLARYRLDFHTDFLTLSRGLHGFVIILYTRHHAQLHKLQSETETPFINNIS